MSEEKTSGYAVLEAKDHKGLYGHLARLFEENHEDRLGCKPRIVLAEAYSWKADADGRLVLGKCRKASDLDRQLHGWDFIIIVHHDLLHDRKTYTEAQLLAVLDHELCHCAVQEDAETGEPKRNEDGDIVYRVRKHDIEEFQEIVNRHGLYKGDVEAFAKEVLAKRNAPLLAETDDESEDAA